MSHKLRAFLQTDSGALVPVAGLVLSVLMLIVIMAVDTARLTNLSHKSKVVADAAAMNAVTKVRALIDENQQDQVDPLDIEGIARDAFTGFIEQEGLEVSALAVNFSQDGDNYNITMDYELKVDRIFGDEPFKVGDKITASTNFTKASAFMDIHLMIDMSSSMSTGATFEDQVNLIMVHNCNFACHQDRINDARNRGISLRQDKVIDALHTLADKAEDAIAEYALEEDSSHFHLYTFNTGTTSRGTHENIPAFRSGINSISSLSPSGGTNGQQSLNWLKSHRLQNGSGDGFTPESRKDFVFFLTDGMNSAGSKVYTSPGGRGLITTETCQMIKDTGTTLAIIYTKYENYELASIEAVGHNNWPGHYQKYADFPISKVTSHFSQCASDDFFFETSSPTQLANALEELYKNAIEKTKGAPRITS